MTLAAFQDRFVRTLLDPELPAPPAFAVYRNTVIKGCIDALQGNYPTVARLVGDEWFRAAALRFVREHPPRAPMLVEYGEGFSAFLETFPPAAEPACLRWRASIASGPSATWPPTSRRRCVGRGSSYPLTPSGRAHARGR